ncbi:glycosyltransferase family 4 protein [Pontibacter sp. HSC-14F20]|uniref:glycosyltransferase family 4 protein n=1 Tax=Pontibacter sp. HSC-14F20 TaxID=2864136 RepID=UPI001C737C91|nr:glycosyltransferase family 4 protein [Pontibacter sp. HSC-14F20]MBX0333246.1 glycosyltransferase family 4 protein [Pontibacter sp. HSC-14F20]
MKVLQLVTKRQYRGAEVFAANLSRELIKKDISVIFAGLYSAPDNPLEVEGALNIDLGGTKSKLISLTLLFSLLKLVNREQPDIIQANGSDTLKYAASLKYLKPNLPITYRNISIISTWIGKNKIKQAIYQTLFAPFDYVTCVGEAARQDFIHTIGFAPDKVSVINRGIPMHAVDKTAARLKLIEEFKFSDNVKIVTHVGNFSPEKNHVFLLNVFEYLKQKESSVKLVLWGEGVLLEEIRKDIASRGLKDTVFLGGFNSKIQDVIAGSDLFALCSIIEGVPGVIMEAAAQRVPAIAVDVGGVKEVVQNGKTGILIPHHDSKIFAEEVLKLLGNNSIRESMGNSAFQLAKECYDPTTNLRKFISLYETMQARYVK